jgi:hypothetical protein
MVAAMKDVAKEWDYDRVSKSNSSQGHGEEIQKAKRSIVMSTGAEPGLNRPAIEQLTSHKILGGSHCALPKTYLQATFSQAERNLRRLGKEATAESQKFVEVRGAGSTSAR